ncbi:MAG: hypothetical protein AMJ79_11350 [Phycisphaerae bacterium SM23_30]|nr:MAG: hypothetical protein AMJ79_11350 [Phycisphaerae bacterium SM23_30]
MNNRLITMVVAMGIFLGVPRNLFGFQKADPTGKAAPAAEKIKMEILYVGQPDTDRAKSFVKLLSDNFSKVEMLNQEEFKAEKTTEFDVVVLDYVRARRPRGEQAAQRAQGAQRARAPGLQLPEGYSKPTIVFGSFGVQQARAWLNVDSSLFYT